MKQSYLYSQQNTVWTWVRRYTRTLTPARKQARARARNIAVTRRPESARESEEETMKLWHRGNIDRLRIRYVAVNGKTTENGASSVEWVKKSWRNVREQIVNRTATTISISKFRGGTRQRRFVVSKFKFDANSSRKRRKEDEECEMIRTATPSAVAFAQKYLSSHKCLWFREFAGVGSCNSCTQTHRSTELRCYSAKFQMAIKRQS